MIISNNLYDIVIDLTSGTIPAQYMQAGLARGSQRCKVRVHRSLADSAHRGSERLRLSTSQPSAAPAFVRVLYVRVDDEIFDSQNHWKWPYPLRMILLVVESRTCM